jgi:NAD(P)H-dependent flavin oxidoreductase YrpB (nitropropane dioxygenase family)
VRPIRQHLDATTTTLAEAKAAESAGADVIIAQGMEAGGHRCKIAFVGAIRAFGPGTLG